VGFSVGSNVGDVDVVGRDTVGRDVA